MDLLGMFRFCYILIIGSFILMVWVSLCGGTRESISYPPCYFNPLCSCSKGIPDLGIVQCHNVHLPRIPETINISKVFMLHLENNHLRAIEPHFLQSTGLYKIVISRNPLHFISDEAFLGLERSLWELDLSYNHLTRIPNRALRYLQKLRLLDLRGNDIGKLSPDNWRGLENSLTHLILSDNSINALPTDSFSGLPNVETIDLHGNNLHEIDASVFRDGMGKLSKLILADNQLSSIPYQALSYLKALKYLDLSRNRINKMQPAAEVGVQNVNYNFQLSLDVIRLDFNQITELEPVSFRYFNVLNKTYLDGNQFNHIQENAFRQAKMKELYLRQCGLKEISPLAFNGLENYLEVLDLSGNHIAGVQDGIFQRFEAMKSLSFRDNILQRIDPIFAQNGFQFTLLHLDLSGNENPTVFLQDLRRLRNLRVLSVSRLRNPAISPEDFAEFGVDLEELRITLAGLQTIKNNAFKHVHGLKMLDFSDNSISNIEPKAFDDIGHSLTALKMSHALSTSVQNFPSEAFRTLASLEVLDVSNNRLKNLPDTSFHFLKNIQRLFLHDNIIELLYKGTFQGDIHRNLKEISLSFNNVRLIQQHTFVDLNQLEEIHLDDNKIDSIDKLSFKNLAKLKSLNLKGNKIATLSYETFQNIPELEHLDLSYNSLTNFEFAMLDQVGTLAMLKVNASHNKLNVLAPKPELNYQDDLGSLLHANIKILDLSFNNISSISKQFFRPAELSLSHLHLAHNHLLNATKEIFGNMPHLQFLDLSHNTLYELDFDTFRNTRRLQIFTVSHNRIAEIPNDLFRFLNSLRIVDFSHNRLRQLPDNLFRESSLERLDVSHNSLGKLPLMSLSIASAASLCELDLSWNSISSLSHGGILSRFKNLAWLDLSYNRLAQIDAATFKGLPKLADLNLGHNVQLSMEINGLSFQGLEYSLLHLNLDNVSLHHLPAFTTPHLVSLSLAFNSLPIISSEMASNLTSLVNLNLNFNDLSTIPIVTHSLTELRYLYMRGNPISTMTNTSLLGVAQSLEELDLRDIDFTTFESGAFCKLNSLRSVSIDFYRNVKNFNVPRLLHQADGLKNLEVHFNHDVENINHEMFGEFPLKLSNLTLTGRGLKKVTAAALQGIQSPNFNLELHNTSVTKLQVDIFRNLPQRVKNVTIDVRDNILLKSVQNPSTGSKPNLGRSIFLTRVFLSGNNWNCDCDLGWVEVWQRKKRQHLCEDADCREAEDDLRSSVCANKNNQSLIEALKSEIECGWSSSTKLTNFALPLLFIPIFASKLLN